MRVIWRGVLPLVLAVLLLTVGAAPYARFLASATRFTCEAVPPSRRPSAVRAHGAVLAVHHAEGVSRVPVGPIGWNLPVLLCLWAWTVGSGWRWLGTLTLGLVACHVLVADVLVRATLCSGAGLPYAMARAWIHWLAALTAVTAAAAGSVLLRSPCGVAGVVPVVPSRTRTRTASGGPAPSPRGDLPQPPEIPHGPSPPPRCP